MASDVAPPNMVKAGLEADKEIPGCTFSGVLGDKAHTYGYHRGRNVLPSGDYSVRLSLDKLGTSRYASALDLSFTAAQMKVVTARLRKSALDPNDPRMGAVREFYGTLNGRTVFGLTHTSENGFWSPATSDSSHLWHIHLSFFRKFSNDYKSIRGVVDVMKGVPWKSAPVVKPKPKPPVVTTPRPPVVVPTPPVTPTKPTTHTVVKGDTLSGLAKRYGLTVDELILFNNLAVGGILRIGKILNLRPPGGNAPNVPVTPEVKNVDQEEARANVWSVKYRRYWGNKDFITVAALLYDMDARLKRIEDKLNETTEGVGDVPPTA